MHKNASGHSRSAIVMQTMENEPSIKNYAEYIPIEDAVEKIRKWQEQGGEIVYLTSRKTYEQVNDIFSVLQKYNFPAGVLEYRKNGEKYRDVAERITPNILIEDDCESIGGEKEMTYQRITQEAKEKIKQVIVKEFEGIDHLPDDVMSLYRFGI